MATSFQKAFRRTLPTRLAADYTEKKIKMRQNSHLGSWRRISEAHQGSTKGPAEVANQTRADLFLCPNNHKGYNDKSWSGRESGDGFMMETCTKRKAVLVFAAGAGLDLARRKWPKSFRRLLPLPFLDAPFPDADLHIFTSPDMAATLVGKPGVEVHRQPSSSFGVNLRGAVDLLADRGYEQIVVVGRDCPELSREDVAEAFSRLSSHRLVLGPDHKGGVYLIAFAASRRRLLRGIRWRRNTDCRQLCVRFGPERTFLLPVKQDLDDLNDVRRLARQGVKLRTLAEALLQAAPEFRSEPRPNWSPRNGDCERVTWQLPPPA